MMGSFKVCILRVNTITPFGHFEPWIEFEYGLKVIDEDQMDGEGIQLEAQQQGRDLQEIFLMETFDKEYSRIRYPWIDPYLEQSYTTLIDYHTLLRFNNLRRYDRRGVTFETIPDGIINWIKEGFYDMWELKKRSKPFEFNEDFVKRLLKDQNNQILKHAMSSPTKRIYVSYLYFGENGVVIPTTFTVTSIE